MFVFALWILKHFPFHHLLMHVYLVRTGDRPARAASLAARFFSALDRDKFAAQGTPKDLHAIVALRICFRKNQKGVLRIFLLLAFFRRICTRIFYVHATKLPNRVTSDAATTNVPAITPSTARCSCLSFPYIRVSLLLV